MRRFFVPSVAPDDDEVFLEGDEAHHAINVLRLSRGERLIVLNGKGMEFICECIEQNKKALRARVLERKFKQKPLCEITLIVAIPKGKLIEEIIERAVELGVSRIIPISTQRTVPDLDMREIEKRKTRWEQIVVSAIKQCGQAYLPEVEKLTELSLLLSERRSFDISLLCSLIGERSHPRRYFEEFAEKNGRIPKSVAVWVGPEGDFTEEETDRILKSGAKPITLGDLVLRVETAVFYILSVVNYEIQWQCRANESGSKSR